MQLNGKEGLKSLNLYLWDLEFNLEFNAHEDNIYVNDHIAHMCMMSLTY